LREVKATGRRQSLGRNENDVTSRESKLGSSEGR